MDEQYPIASRSFSTVKPNDTRGILDSGVCGQKIIDAVKAVMREYGDEELAHYYQERRYANHDLYRIGRRTHEEKLNVLVTADGSEWILPSGVYKSFAVVSLARTSDPRLCQSSDHDDVIEFVCNFADLIKIELMVQEEVASV